MRKRVCVCVCVCVFTHVLHVDVLARTHTRARRLLGCCLDCCLVMEIETLFLFIPPPAVTVVSGASSLNSGLWDTWRSVKSTNPPNYAECYSPEHALDSYYGKQKLRGAFKRCATFTRLSYLYIFVSSSKYDSFIIIFLSLSHLTSHEGKR